MAGLFDAIGSILSANSTSKAISKASDAQIAASNAAQASITQGSDAARQAYLPYLTTGTSALSRLAQLYGLADGGTITQAGIVGGVNNGATGSATSAEEAYLAANPDVAREYATHSNLKTQFGNEAAYADYHYNAFGKTEGRQSPTADLQASLPASVPTAAAASAPTATSDPYATFYQSPDYQFKLAQGIKGLDATAAASGALDSGATRKAAITYAGNLASGQYNDYVSKLQNLAGIGQSATAGTAGVDTAAATNLATSQTNAGNSLVSSYLARGQNQSNLFGSIAGGLTSAASSFLNPAASFLSPFTASGGGLSASYSF